MTPVPGKEGADQLRILLRPGETFELPDGRGSITFDKVERFAYLPFGAGPRVCLGKHLGLMEAVLLMAMIIRDWQPRLREAVLKSAALAVTSTPEEMTRFLAREIEVWREVIKSANVTIQ